MGRLNAGISAGFSTVVSGTHWFGFLVFVFVFFFKQIDSEVSSLSS